MPLALAASLLAGACGDDDASSAPDLGVDAAPPVDGGTTPEAGPDAAAGDDASAADAAPADAPGACGASAGLDAAAALAGVFFVSESDYPWEAFGAVGTGASSVSPAAVADAAGLTGRTETRAFAEFWARFAEDDEAAKYAAAKEILEARLTMLTVVRVIPAAAPAEIHIFVVGLTPCGEIVGIRTISIET